MTRQAPLSWSEGRGLSPGGRPQVSMSLFDPGENVQVLQAPNEWAGDVRLLCSWVFTLLAILLVCGSVSPNAPRLPPPPWPTHP